MPPSINKSFWVSRDKASGEYLEQMGAFIAWLVLDVTPASIDWKKDILLGYVEPDQHGELKTRQELEAARLKRINASTFFMQQQLVPEQIGYSCQSLFEELFLQCILPHLPKQFNAALELGWSERNITMDFCLRYDGDAYDPLTDAANDELALFLVHRAAPQLRYRYEGQMNYLEGTLAQDKS